MHIYYHVEEMEKRKKCKFRFSYIKGINMYILGNVNIDCSRNAFKVVFDRTSDLVLTSEEKEGIVSCVVRHLDMDMQCS